MRWSTAAILIVSGAALAGFVFSSNAVRSNDTEPTTAPSVAAGRQTADLGWRETFGQAGQQLVFEVDRFEVLKDGWRASVRVTNDTSVAYEVGDPLATLDRSFGVMLFETGDLAELEQRNRDGRLPSIRAATRYEPELPRLIEPRGSWEGVISAPGALVAGSWARIVFGTLVAIGETGDVLQDRVVWITDHAYHLER